MDINFFEQIVQRQKAAKIKYQTFLLMMVRAEATILIGPFYRDGKCSVSCPLQDQGLTSRNDSGF
jgi:hypothetical protein